MDNNRKTETRRKDASDFQAGSALVSMNDNYSWETMFIEQRGRSLIPPVARIAHQALTYWLNDEDPPGVDVRPDLAHPPESTERIKGLLALVRATIQHLESPAGSYRQKVAEMWRITNLTVTLLDIDHAYQDYATAPYLVYQARTGLYGIGQKPVAKEGSETYNVIGVEFTHRPQGEVMAAHGILELARCGLLDRIRTCECGQWYFARKKDGVACSGTCRQRIHDRKPEVKARRAAKAKANRLYTSGKVYIS